MRIEIYRQIYILEVDSSDGIVEDVEEYKSPLKETVISVCCNA